MGNIRKMRYAEAPQPGRSQDLPEPMKRPFILALFLSALFAAGCTARNQPFLHVQFCVGNDEGVEKLKSELVAIAQAENLEWVDGSDTSKSGMGIKVDPVVYVSLERDGRVVMMGGNLFRPKYEIYLSFLPNDNLPEAKAFASRVLTRLRTLWTVSALPESKTYPSLDCPPADEIVKPASNL